MSPVLRTENVERQNDMIFYGSIQFYTILFSVTWTLKPALFQAGLRGGLIKFSKGDGINCP